MAENVEFNGPAVECEAGNQKVTGSTPGAPEDPFETEPPKLRFQGEETPKPTPRQAGAKRPALELSPIPEGDAFDIKKLISDGIKEAMKSAVSDLVESVKREIKEFVKAEIANAVGELREELMQVIQAESDATCHFLETKNDAKALCEAEVLETYNRRDNIKIFGALETDVTGRESMENTMSKVLEIAGLIEADVKESDISIAHRLPARGPNRPIIVKFSRRVAKVQMMRRKRELKNKESGKDIRIVEDVSKARANFMGMLRADNRLNYVWSKEGTIYYTKVNDDTFCRITNLLDGAFELGYNVDDVMNCFRK